MPDVITIGEVLIDFLSVDKGVSIEETTGFTIACGGAPANVAAAISKLGESSGFIGKVGADSFGRKIKATLEKAGVDIKNLVMDKGVNTTLAFISVKGNGDVDFTFYRNHCGADISLNQEEIDEGYILESKIFHFGSLSFTNEPLKSATLYSIEKAKGTGKIISFDPNLRPSLWDSMKRAREEIENAMQYADVVKLTDEELSFVTKSDDLVRGSNLLLKYGPRVILVTRGSNPCFFNNGDFIVEVPAFDVEVKDVTGGGDAFMGGFIVKLVKRLKDGKSIFSMDKDEAIEILKFANACGAITVTRKGVIPALPTMKEVEDFLSSRI